MKIKNALNILILLVLIAVTPTLALAEDTWTVDDSQKTGISPYLYHAHTRTYHYEDRLINFHGYMNVDSSNQFMIYEKPFDSSDTWTRNTTLETGIPKGYNKHDDPYSGVFFENNEDLCLITYRSPWDSGTYCSIIITGYRWNDGTQQFDEDSSLVTGLPHYHLDGSATSDTYTAYRTAWIDTVEYQDEFYFIIYPSAGNPYAYRWDADTWTEVSNDFLDGFSTSAGTTFCMYSNEDSLYGITSGHFASTYIGWEYDATTSSWSQNPDVVTGMTTRTTKYKIADVFVNGDNLNMLVGMDEIYYDSYVGTIYIPPTPVEEEPEEDNNDYGAWLAWKLNEEEPEEEIIIEEEIIEDEDEDEGVSVMFELNERGTNWFMYLLIALGSYVGASAVCKYKETLTAYNVLICGTIGWLIPLLIMFALGTNMLFINTLFNTTSLIAAFFTFAIYGGICGAFSE